MTPELIGLSILILGLALVAGKLVRIRVRLLSKIFLPSSVIAGLLLLMVGPEVLGAFLKRTETFEHLEYGVLSEDIISVFSALPVLLISVVFAALFLGKKIPSLKEIWFIAGPQVSFGQTLAWGQYVFGILVTILILTPFFGINPMAGALIEIGFEGGHGTSAGLADTFEELGFAEGLDLALGLATIGVVSGVVFGIFFVNWAIRNGHAKEAKLPSELKESRLIGVPEPDEREKSGVLTTSPQSIEPLALHIGLIAIAVLIGKGILQLLLMLENATWGADGETVIVGYLPLFPLAMVGGVVLQLFLDRFDKFRLVDRDTIQRIQGLALDFLIVGAIASLSLQVIGENIWVFLILAATGIGWNIAAFFFLARRMIPKYWFERGVGDFGQSMGMTPIALMLIQIVDNKGNANAMEAFGYKQLLFEPVVGGGLMTALSLPLIFQFGPVAIMIFSFVVMTAWLLVGLLYFGRQR